MKRSVMLATLLVAGFTVPASADIVTDWNRRCAALISEAKLGTPPAIRVMALVQTAAFDAANAVTLRYPITSPVAGRAKGASVDAAIAAAHRTVLVKILPAQQASIEAAYQAALANVAEGSARAAGISLGEQAAERLLAARAEDNPAVPVAYRPHATPGTYVPTAAVAVPQWGARKPWNMKSAAQFRPAAPPALTSAAWARDFEEVKALGGKVSTQRTPEQAEIGKFWEYSLPEIYFGVVRSIAEQPGREVTRNALLFAMAAQAMDDALIGVFEAKYHHNFWRPLTAIRNGDLDGNDATVRDAAWMPLVDAPMHPEYPSGHAILAGAAGAVMKADLGTGPVPVLSTSSPTAKGATRQWTSVDAFMQEVAEARIYAGIHYRTAVEVGVEMGRRIGELAATRMKVPTQ